MPAAIVWERDGDECRRNRVVERQRGDPIVDRGTQIIVSALGQATALNAKAAWEPDFRKRTMIAPLSRR